MRIIGGYQSTKLNEEDFAITPYLSAVYVNEDDMSVYGIGFTWEYASVYIGLGFNLPEDYPSIVIQKEKI